MADLEKYRETLIKEFQRSDIKKYCFVGAGISTMAGISNWEELIKNMLKELKKHCRSTSTIKDLEEAIKKSDWLSGAQIFKESSLTYKQKHEFFMRQFITHKDPKPIHTALIKLPFDGILTTNFDHLLEDAYAFVYGKSLVSYLPNNWKDNRHFEFPDHFFIAKLHGDINDWSNVVLDRGSYLEGNWVDLIRKKIEKNSLIVVIGVGGYDYFVNNFLLKADYNHTIYLYMLPDSGLEFERHAKSFLTQELPDNVNLISDLNKEELMVMFTGLGHIYEYENLIDSPWGEMPLSVFNLDFGKATVNLRKFFFSDSTIAIIKSEPGFGLSSFISESLRDRAKARNVHVFRLEGKEYLPLEAYVYHILAALYNIDHLAYDSFMTMRKKAAKGWNEEDEALALAEAFDRLKFPVIIAIEHIDRVIEKLGMRKMNNFLENLLAKESVRGKVKLILAVSDKRYNRFDIGKHSPKHIPFESISQESCKILCEQRNGLENELVQTVIDINPQADINTITLISFLLIRTNQTIDQKIKNLILSCDHIGLCKRLIRSLNNDETTIKILKICALFRTPRSLDALHFCSNIDIFAIKIIISKLVDVGFLMPNQNGTKWSISTSIRKALIKILFERNGIGEKRVLNRRIGEYFESKIQFEDHLQNESDEGIHRSIPFISTALFYYRMANDPVKYYKLILKIKDQMIDKYHFNLVETWLDEAPQKETNDKLLNYRTVCIRLKIALIRSFPKEFEKELKEAKRKLNEIDPDKLPGEILEMEKKKMSYNEGILYTLKRKYSDALVHFEKESVILNEKASRFDLKMHLRIVQTELSLGQLRQAKTHLEEIEEFVQGLEHNTDIVHHKSLIMRHWATINIILLMQNLPSNVKELSNVSEFRKAMDYSEKCIKFSAEVNDFTGIGIGELKKAQVYYSIMMYDEVINYASIAINNFASFPNNRWWMIVCNDLIAKSYAHKNKIKKAGAYLRIARDIWENSSREDELRRCELDYTEGIIHLQKGELEKSYEMLVRSIDFSLKESPFIYRIHLRKVIEVASMLRKYEDVKKYINTYKRINIDIN